MKFCQTREALFVLSAIELSSSKLLIPTLTLVLPNKYDQALKFVIALYNTVLSMLILGMLKADKENIGVNDKLP